MSDKLTKAEVLAKAVRELNSLWNTEDREELLNKMFLALAAYEAAPDESLRAESQAAGDWKPALHAMSCEYPEGCSCGASKHNSVVSRLAAAQARIAELEASKNHHRELGITLLDAKYLDPNCHKGCQSLVWQARVAELLRELSDNATIEIEHSQDFEAVTNDLKQRVAVLEKALANIIQKCGEDYDERDPFDDIQQIALAAQPSRENEI